jgi:glycogen debranching enzyme
VYGEGETAGLLAQESGPGGEVTLLEGSSFCRSERSGDVTAQRPEGLFYKDTRIVSRWELLLDDRPIEPFGVVGGTPFSATFLGRAAARPGHVEPTVLVERRRMVADGMREDIVVRNFGAEPVGATLTLTVDSDFADLFSVKDGRPVPPGQVRHRCAEGTLELWVQFTGERRGVRVRGHGSRSLPGMLSWRLAVPPHGCWSTTVEVLPSTDGIEVASSFPLDRPVEATAPAGRMREWQRSTPDVHCDDPVLQSALKRSVLDLGALRISDPDFPDTDVIAAGAPWFMALFGRDSLLTSWLMLPWDLELARGTLHTLARLQGREVDPLSEEEPGRILHEVRLGIDESRALGGSRLYFGTVDATPLFVMLLGRAVRWGLPAADIASLLPAADRALEWIAKYGDSDGDGFVEYQRKTDRGLLNQGWKDSQDSIVFRDGKLARGPIALAEVQGYVYAAYCARADLADASGDPVAAREWRERAAELKRRFNEAFWLPDEGYFALALDGDKRSVDALASNQGHCLWTGIVDESKAPSVAAALMSDRMFSGWGVRTLATDMAAFNPVSYHNGSVWPHDNALIVQGLCRYGFVAQAAELARGLVEASAHFGGRLPELFCGFSREDVPIPVGYPTSCSPQAWAAAAPLGVVSALLGLQADATGAEPVLRVTCNVPPEWGRVGIERLALGDRYLSVDSATLPHGRTVELVPALG